ncbi:MAG: acyl-ACP desaturase, partial [Actinomycetota bacterium]|nr:acyl-ACP desaturase [Actinomycetota bacterium]
MAIESVDTTRPTSQAGAAPAADDDLSGTDRMLLHELRPHLDTLLDRHLTAAKEWFPHEYVPWSRGRDFEPDEEWNPEEFPLPDAVRRALVVNLLTEDNLPYYFATIDRVFGHEGWEVWTRRWTAEEMRHAAVIRDYLMVTRAVDATALERARMIQVSGGETPQPPTVADGLVYLCLQELATRIAHRNTGKAISDSAGYKIMGRVAADENLHYLFYRDLASAALRVDPSTMVMAVDRQVREFEMPGTGIPGFNAHAQVIARAGIYDLAIHHDQILVPVVVNHWNIAALTGLSPEAEQARDRVLGHIERVGSVG